MKITGIIAEYNPFHNGHILHMNRSRELTGADGIVVIMSGDFVQRGEPAIVDKYRRTAMALAAGADAVLELPVSWATGTAERFAFGGVHALHSLGAVTDLVCGAESPDSDLWSRVTEFLNHPDADFDDEIRTAMDTGMTYPAARAAELEKRLPGAGALLASPNNILALEYRRAIASIPDCSITPHEIRREGNDYNDRDVAESGSYASASAIRRMILSGPTGADTLSELSRVMPHVPAMNTRATEQSAGPAMNAQTTVHSAVPACNENPFFPYYIDPDSLSGLLRYSIEMQTTEELSGWQDMNIDLACRLKKIHQDNGLLTFTEYAQRLKSRNITLTRANRALLHCVLRLKDPIPNASGAFLQNHEDAPKALRLLGMRRSSPVMHELMNHTSIPIVTRMADAPAGVFEDDIRASHIYNQLVFSRTSTVLKDEFRQGPVIQP